MFHAALPLRRLIFDYFIKVNLRMRRGSWKCRTQKLIQIFVLPWKALNGLTGIFGSFKPLPQCLIDWNFYLILADLNSVKSKGGIR